VHVLFHTPWHLSKGKIQSHLAKTLSRWPMHTIFFNKIITGDETWCFAYDPETKRQSSKWVDEISSRPKKLKSQRSSIKTMLIIFFDSQGVVHKEFVPEGKIVNAEFYKEVMDRLLMHIQRARPTAFWSRNFFPVAPPVHKDASVCQFLTQKCYNPLLPRTLQINLRQTIFCSPCWKCS
jgi:hypothetical protein